MRSRLPLLFILLSKKRITSDIPTFPCFKSQMSSGFGRSRTAPLRHTAAGAQPGRPQRSFKRRTCRYLRDLAKRRLGHSHVPNNPASSDGYLQAFQVYARNRPSNRGRSHPASFIGHHLKAGTMAGRRLKAASTTPLIEGRRGWHPELRQDGHLLMKFTGCGLGSLLAVFCCRPF